MSDVHWIKLAVDTFTDEKVRLIEAMPQGDTLLVIWLKLLTLAGKTNDDGFIYVSSTLQYTPDRLSIVINRPSKTVQTALKTFTDLGMIEQTDKGIHITNWTKHQNAEKLERIRERTRARVAKHRSTTCNAVCNADVTLSETLHVTPCNAVEVEVESRDRVDDTPPPSTDVTTGAGRAKDPAADPLNPWTVLSREFVRYNPAQMQYGGVAGNARTLKKDWDGIKTPEELTAQIRLLVKKKITGRSSRQLFDALPGSHDDDYNQGLKPGHPDYIPGVEETAKWLKEQEERYGTA